MPSEGMLMRDLSLHSKDLKRYQEELDAEITAIEDGYIQDFVNQGDPFIELHEEIVSCDRILSSMEAHLAAFHTDLGGLGEEIRAIQTQSASLLQQLANRKSMVKMIDDLFESILISQSLVDVILRGQINESYVRAIGELNGKADSLCQLSEEAMIAAREVFPQINLLRQTASQRICDYFVAALSLFKRKKSNVQSIQKQNFLAYRDLFRFIAIHSPEGAKQVREAYVAMLRKYYHSLFSKYIGRLVRLELPTAARDGWIVQLEDTIKSHTHALFRSSSRSGSCTSSSLAALTLGRRACILEGISAASSSTIIIPHVAESSRQKFGIEVLFKSLERMVIDTLSSECLFLRSFFSASPEELKSLFHDIFSATNLMVQREIKARMVDRSDDGLGLLLCIRVNQEHELAFCASADFALMEPLFHEANMMLWPKFQSLLERHIESMKRTRPQELLYFPLLPSTRRFSHFYASLLSLNEKYRDAALELSCQRLFAAYFELLQGVSESNSHAAAGADDHQNIFLLNNVGFCFNVLSDVLPDSDSKFKEDLYNQYQGLVKELTERLVLCYFSSISSLNRSLQSLSACAPSALPPPKSQVEQQVKEILSSYPVGLNELNTLLMGSFYSPRLGAAIFRSVLERFLVLYKATIDLTEQYTCATGDQLITRLEPMDVVLGEIKKFKTFISNVEPT